MIPNPLRTIVRRARATAARSAVRWGTTLLIASCAPSVLAAPADAGPRRVLSLDGTWEIAEGTLAAVPATFSRTVSVPGLVSLATPAFASPPGPPLADRRKTTLPDPAREAFWYRRTFRFDGPVPAVARLKVHKAMFTSQVILNGRALGDHAPSFTPGYFDVRAALRSGENVLLIRIGASLDSVPRGYANASEFEKLRYIPGILDSVELILSGTPHLVHVQTAPDIAQQTVRVAAVLRNDGAAAGRTAVTFVVREAGSGRVVGREHLPAVACAATTETAVDVRIPIADCRLWSPESPFLYRLEVDCGTDKFTTRFGMREFRFDPATGRAVLNGRPYFMRGTNFTLYRFFEDPDCGDLPWRADWVRRLHQRVKDMQWNCVRYCIGFPPEAWYDVADELGILVQDEFPVWGIGAIEADKLASEYTGWMRERWNHPSVVIWDAQNETRSPVTGEALTQVRHLDLSGRPWDNGWAPPMAATDSLETHPYHFSNPCFLLGDLALASRSARVGPAAKGTTHAIIVNEYGWLWLNRDGTPTTLTRDLYRNLAGPNASSERRRHLHATHLAADTEFWRSYREVAAVMHFTTLGYSHADGQTSDHWLDVRTLQWEPQFERYVRDAFAPVGLMIEFWRGTALLGSTARVPVRLINDLDSAWSGAVKLRLRPAGGGTAAFEQQQAGAMPPHGQAALEFSCTWPPQPGAYVLEAEIAGAGGGQVRSVREITVIDRAALGLAHGGSASASSNEKSGNGPAAAVDGDPATYWVSKDVDPSWLAVDLGGLRRIRRVRLQWGLDRSIEFQVQASRDGWEWQDLPPPAGEPTSTIELSFTPVDARHVRVVCTKRRGPGPGGWPAAQRTHSIREIQVFD